jgi:hypothetical protein
VYRAWQWRVNAAACESGRPVGVRTHEPGLSIPFQDFLSLYVLVQHKQDQMFSAGSCIRHMTEVQVYLPCQVYKKRCSSKMWTLVLNSKPNQFWIHQAISNTLKMGMKSVLETSENFHTLARLSVQEHFTAFCCRKSFKTYNFQHSQNTDFIAVFKSELRNIAAISRYCAAPQISM